MNNTCIINPKTGRAVKIDGKIGKKLSSNTTDKPKEPPKPKTTAKPKAAAKPKEVPKPKEAPKPIPKKVEPKTKNDIDELVNEINTNTFYILMYQKATSGNEKINAMIKKIEYLGKKNFAVIPSDLFSFYPDFLNALIDKYGASEKTIRMINDNMIEFIKYVNGDAILPDELDMKYFLKYMNQRNKNKFSFLLTKK